jgi:hypothetical protein
LIPFAAAHSCRRFLYEELEFIVQFSKSFPLGGMLAKIFDF